MKTAKQVRVEDLMPGMVTLNWIVMGEPVNTTEPDGSASVLVKMRHRIDGGLSHIAYNAGHEITVIEEDEE